MVDAALPWPTTELEAMMTTEADGLWTMLRVAEGLKLLGGLAPVVPLSTTRVVTELSPTACSALWQAHFSPSLPPNG